MSLLSFGEDREASGQAALLAAAILAEGRGLIDVFNAAGLLSWGGGLVPMLALNAARADEGFPFGPPVPPPGQRDGEVFRLGALRGSRPCRHLSEALASATPARDPPAWFDEVRLLILPPPSAHAAPGDAVFQASAGTLGFGVGWGARSGFLTAGHVAAAGGGPVRENAPPMNPTVGNVLVSRDPAGQGTMPGADVAVIATGGARPGRARIPVTAEPSAPLSIRARGGLTDRVRATVRAYVQFYHSAAIGGTWGDCYMTVSGVTLPGDSGAPVASAAGDPVGTVVAGTPGLFDLVQDVGFQLRATGLQGISVI